MAYLVQDIAKWILTRNKCEVELESGDCISNLKLQKLLYYSQGCYLALKDRPLFDEEIEAWTYGPVVPEIYQTYKKFGNLGIDTTQMSFNPEIINSDDITILEEVYDEFGQFSASKLVKMTHEETPWKSTYSPYSNNTISKDVIKKYFKENYVE